MYSAYICPKTKSELIKSENSLSLKSESGEYYPIEKISELDWAPNFLAAYKLKNIQKKNLDIYDQKYSIDRYKNELDWLYETFGTDNDSFRQKNIELLNLQPGNKVLITACGLGSDILPILKAIGPSGSLFVQDLAAEMVYESCRYIRSLGILTQNIFFSISDAQKLQFRNQYFDAVFHFGGINLFDNIQNAIGEMSRVVKFGGKVVFGDESVAPWLRNTDYARAVIKNNSLWEIGTPIDLLPKNAIDVNLTWTLGNCFYLISFTVSESGPYINMDVKHKSPRGGTIRTRFFGQLEGVSPGLIQLISEEAKHRKISIHDLLEKFINDGLSINKLSKK
jgi:ubiquinone/menaquinone biosynthesis C-methylase UbiE